MGRRAGVLLAMLLVLPGTGRKEYKAVVNAIPEEWLS
jgi:hypothetical protein